MHYFLTKDDDLDKGEFEGAFISSNASNFLLYKKPMDFLLKNPPAVTAVCLYILHLFPKVIKIFGMSCHFMPSAKNLRVFLPVNADTNILWDLT